MRASTGLSRCSSGKPVHFAWFGFPEVLDGNHVSAATFAFLSAIETANREINDYQRATLVAEFQDRILQASEGKLGNTRKIKRIALFPDLPLFEIRWQGMSVRERGADGVITSKNLALRMYHSEPSELVGFFIGHHIHEKRAEDPLTEKRIQNTEIARAAEIFREGRAILWGIG